MIKNLKIENFQSHKDTNIDFKSGINIITVAGPNVENDIGKTSIFRGIVWNIKNRPLGNGFIRKGQNKPAKSVLSTDSATVTRCKGKSENYYSLVGYKLDRPQSQRPISTRRADSNSLEAEKVANKRKKYSSHCNTLTNTPKNLGCNLRTAFGTEPPSEIVEALNFKDINIQSSHDKHFLVLDSPGQVAIKIREAAKLDIIDKLSNLIKNKLNNKESEITAKKAELAENSKNLSELLKIDLNRLDTLVEAGKGIVEAKSDTLGNCQKLTVIGKDLRDIEKQEERLPDVVSLEHLLVEAFAIESVYLAKQKQLGELELISISLKKIKDNEEKLPDVEQLEKLLNEFSGIEIIYTTKKEIYKNLVSFVDEIKTVKKKLKKYSKVDFSHNFSIETNLELYNNIERDFKNLGSLIEGIEKVTKQLEEKKQLYDKGEKEYKDMMSKLDICPMCETTLDSKSRERLLNNVSTE